MMTFNAPLMTPLIFSQTVLTIVSASLNAVPIILVMIGMTVLTIVRTIMTPFVMAWMTDCPSDCQNCLTFWNISMKKSLTACIAGAAIPMKLVYIECPNDRIVGMNALKRSIRTMTILLKVSDFVLSVVNLVIYVATAYSFIGV